MSGVKFQFDFWMFPERGGGSPLDLNDGQNTLHLLSIPCTDAEDTKIEFKRNKNKEQVK